MNFDLDDNQALFKATVERFCAGNDVPSRHRQRKLPGGFDRERWSELAQLGLIALAVSESDGGLGGSDLDCAIVAQALGQGLAVEPWLECGYIPATLLAGTSQSGAVIPGSGIAAFAFAEAGGRYSMDARAVEAKERADGTVLNGEKQFVLGGGAADLFIVTAKLGEATELFVLDRDQADVRSYPVIDGSLAGVVTFRNARAARLPGGLERLEQVVTDASLMAAAEIVGIASRLFDETLAYVKQREQFGQPIGRFQVIQHRLVDAYARIEEIQSALIRALILPNGDRRRQIAGVKAQIADAALAVAHDAVQFHGGMGMTDELAIGHGLKRIQLLAHLFGDSSSNLQIYAEAA